MFPMDSRYIRIAVIILLVASTVKYFWNNGSPPEPSEKMKSQRAVEMEKAKEESVKAIILNKPVTVIAELCSPATGDCYQIRDIVRKVGDVIAVSRRIEAIKNLRSWPIAHSSAGLSVPSKLTIDNVKTANWPVSKTTILFEYAQMLIASGFITGALSFNRSTKQQVLVIGLGGGSIPSFFSVCEMFGPKIETTVVEIDPLFVTIAEKYFGYSDVPGVLNTVIDDGAKFIKKEKQNNRKYSAILLDTAYNTDLANDGLIAPVKVFLEEDIVKDIYDIVEDGGVFAINIVALREKHFHEDFLSKLFSRYFPSCSLVLFRQNQKMLICSKKDNWTWDERLQLFKQNIHEVIKKFEFNHLRFFENE